MGPRAARATHLGLALVGAVLYFVFVLPRWWVLTGDIPATLATAGRIAAGVPIAAAAIPVALNLQRSLSPDATIPELALRLRAWSGVLHVVAGVLIIAAAIAEIWLSLGSAGPWLFGVYGAAGALALVAAAGFALSFTAEKPPAAAKPAKVKAAETAATNDEPGEETEPAGDTEPAEETEAGDGAEPAAAERAAESDATEPATEPATAPDAAEPVAADQDAPASEPPPIASGALLNKRPTGKRRHRLQR